MRTWFKPPDFTFTPDGRLQLGTVIVHPKKPTLVLANLASPDSGIKLPTTSILTEKNHIHKNSHGQTNGFSSWKQFFGVASASAKIDLGGSASVSYGPVDHEIRSFAGPLTAETALEIVALPSVKKHMARSFYYRHRPVYVVSGLRVAKTSFPVTSEVANNTTMDLSGSAPPVPGTLGLGAGVSHHRQKTVADSYETAPGIVFAYQLHVIRYRRAGVETELLQSDAAFMTGHERGDDEGPPIVVQATKEELAADLDEDNDYTEILIGDDDVCISF